MTDLTDPRDILLAPVISEKSYGLLDENKYTFIVRPDANKTQIKIAVEKAFDVKVAKSGVNIINRQGKRKRTRAGFGKRPDTKRAIVTLREGRIEIFGGPVA
jgi:large subunit ribosomal protein L23